MNHQMVALHHGDFHKLLVDVEVELPLMEEFVGGDFYQTTTTTIQYFQNMSKMPYNFQVC